MYCLARHPELYAKVRDDADFRRAFIKEVLRHYPPFPVLGYRYCPDADYMLGKHVIPSGVCMATDVLKLQTRDDASFRPERWLGPRPSSNEDFYFPWGSGPRLCVGRPLAEALLDGVLLSICSRFSRIEFSGTPEMPSANAVNGVTSPSTPLSISFLE